MKIAGIASAFMFLVAVSAIRLGDKPLFVKPGDSEAMSKAYEKQAKEVLAGNKGKYAAPGRR
jgi:hypothetical protein